MELSKTPMTTADIREQVSMALNACEDKKAENMCLLQLDKDSSALADYFLICSGNNPRQVQAISDEVELRLKRAGTYPNHIEGYNQADWILVDYVDFVVHIFSENARKFYSLERLWKSARLLSREELLTERAKVTQAISDGEAPPRKATGGARQGAKRKSSSKVAGALKKYKPKAGKPKPKKTAKKSSAKSRSKRK
jgi:ribosome-associated protein